MFRKNWYVSCDVILTEDTMSIFTQWIKNVKRLHLRKTIKEMLKKEHGNKFIKIKNLEIWNSEKPERED